MAHDENETVGRAIEADALMDALLRVAAVAAARARHDAVAPADRHADPAADALLRAVIAAADRYARTVNERAVRVVAVPAARAVHAVYQREAVAARAGAERSLDEQADDLHATLAAHDVPGASEAVIAALVHDPLPTDESIAEAEGKPERDPHPASRGPKDDAVRAVADLFHKSERAIYGWLRDDGAANGDESGDRPVRVVPTAYGIRTGSVATIKYVLATIGVPAALADQVINETLRAARDER